jgi:hypothetical protein
MRPLVEHWNGKEWTQVEVPAGLPANNGAELIAPVSGQDLWVAVRNVTALYWNGHLQVGLGPRSAWAKAEDRDPAGTGPASPCPRPTVRQSTRSASA